MSKEKVCAVLTGYDGPIFPEKLNKLNTICDKVEFSGLDLEKIGRSIKSFVKKDRASTEDGYTWFWGLYFETGRGEIVVLFPWAQDWDKHQGIQLDRSIAIYTRHEIDHQDVQELLQGLYTAFEDLQRDRV